MIAAKLAMAKMARALVVDRNAWIAGGALIIVAIVVYAIATRKEGYAAYSPTKYPHWGWGANKGLRCKNNNNTGCTTKWEGKTLVDLETPSAPAPSSAKKKDGESCEGGNQCQSGLCSSGKKCYSAPKPSPSSDAGVNAKYPYWGWGANKGLRCKNKDNTGCETKWEGGKLKDKNPAKKKDGEYCTGGNQCESGNCSATKKCVAAVKDSKYWGSKDTWAPGGGLVAPSPAATTDVLRVYPHWGWGANKGLRCKFANNTGCSTKWVGGKLVEA